MFSSDTTRWLTNIIFATPTILGAFEVQKMADSIVVGTQNIPHEAFASLGYSGCALVTIGAVGIISNEMRNHSKWMQSFLPSTNVETLEDQMRARNEAETRAAIQPRIIPNMNEFNQVTMSVRIDHEREFCKTLIDMKRGGFDMNISESYWLKAGHWQAINSQLTPTDFKAMRLKFEYYNIFGKKGKASNSPYVVLNEQAVQMRAEGKIKLPLPQGM